MYIYTYRSFCFLALHCSVVGPGCPSRPAASHTRATLSCTSSWYRCKALPVAHPKPHGFAIIWLDVHQWWHIDINTYTKFTHILVSLVAPTTGTKAPEIPGPIPDAALKSTGTHMHNRQEQRYEWNLMKRQKRLWGSGTGNDQTCLLTRNLPVHIWVFSIPSSHACSSPVHPSLYAFGPRSKYPRISLDQYQKVLPRIPYWMSCPLG